MDKPFYELNNNLVLKREKTQDTENDANNQIKFIIVQKIKYYMQRISNPRALQYMQITENCKNYKHSPFAACKLFSPKSYPKIRN